MVRLIVAAMRDMSGRTPVEPELPTAIDFDLRAPNQRDPATAFHRGTESLAAARDDRSGPPRTEPGAQPSDDRAPQPGPLAEPAQLPRPGASRHAGLWLILPSLVRLGFGEWLAARTELLGDDPARSLILAVATHHRVALDDPALVPFAPFAIDETVPAWTEAWRIGLDRWLRRTARRRTHDLAARPGKVLLGEHRVDIHFPLDAADLRLRRLALDRDPGWVAWLGLAVRYHFGAGAVP